MAAIKPFYCVRPRKDLASRVAALPYDVYNRAEAKAEAAREPLSFLRIDRAETWFSDQVDTYAPCVYEKARDVLREQIRQGIYQKEEVPCYYFYELTRNGHSQTGLVACSSVDDYINGRVKKHENTRPEKEEDRIRHVDVVNAQTGPIFLAYRARAVLRQLVRQVKRGEPLYDFTSPDGIRHRVFRVSDPHLQEQITAEMRAAGPTYLADGHHRAASAVKVALKRRKEHPDYTGKEEFNSFLSILFPDEELQILPYNRVVRDLNGLAAEEFLRRIEANFTILGTCSVEDAEEGEAFLGKILGAERFPEPGCGRTPAKKGQICMLLDGVWYTLEAKEAIRSSDPVKGLDVSILQDFILAPVLGIEDPRTDKRVEFIGGIRGVGELERRVSLDMRVAFSMYPTSMKELFDVADEGRLMPPKSTWFEPKPRSGLFIHEL